MPYLTEQEIAATATLYQSKLDEIKDIDEAEQAIKIAFEKGAKTFRDNHNPWKLISRFGYPDLNFSEKDIDVSEPLLFITNGKNLAKAGAKYKGVFVYDQNRDKHYFADDFDFEFELEEVEFYMIIPKPKGKLDL